MRIISPIVFLALTGCAMDAADDASAGNGGAGGKADGAAPTLAPSYALDLRSTMKTEDLRESDPQRRFASLSIRARALVKVAQSGSDVKLAVDLCDVRLPDLGGYQPELDADFVAGLPPLAVDAVIDGEEPALVSEPVALVLGAALANPLTDTLPGATSSRVRDQDRDGKPGVSITIPGYGRIFGALRVTLAFAAELGDASTLTGAADVTFDKKIYGDDIWFYDAAAEAEKAAQYVQVVSSSNRVEFAPGATSCTKVRQLFP